MKGRMIIMSVTSDLILGLTNVALEEITRKYNYLDSQTFRFILWDAEQSMIDEQDCNIFVFEGINWDSDSDKVVFLKDYLKELQDASRFEEFKLLEIDGNGNRDEIGSLEISVGICFKFDFYGAYTCSKTGKALYN